MPRYWLLAMAICAAAEAAQPPDPPEVATPPASAPGAGTQDANTPRAGTSRDPEPDDDFIEFLGADDVGDTAWWEFLTKAAPRKEQPPVSPPQDAKQ